MELKISDFDNWMNTSTSVANECGVYEETPLTVRIEDEDGELYDIVDVKFSPMTRSIHIKFSHDND
jgi:hypothetical protein